jgi:malonate transporter
VIAAFGPVWILTAVGYLLRRGRIFTDEGVGTLSRYVFHIAMPATLFVTLARTSLSGFGGLPLVAFVVSAAAAGGGGWLLATRWFSRSGCERTIEAMAAGYVNSANLGIPIALQVLGSVSFLVDVVLWQTVLVTPVILLALDRGTDRHARLRWRRLLSLPFRTPIISACVLGVIASATGFRPTGVVHSCLSLVAASAVPVALIALCGSLHRDLPSRERGIGELVAITLIKVVGQPLVGYLVAQFVLGLSAPQVLAVVVCAGLPTAQNTFIFAQEYRVAEALASRAVVMTTVCSLATLALASWWLG